MFHERLWPASSEFIQLPAHRGFLDATCTARAAARAMALLTTPQATLSNRPYVCICWRTTAPRRTGRPRRWCSNWVAWPSVGYAVRSLFWRHQTVDSLTPGKALADLAFPLQVSNRPLLLRTSTVSTAKCPRLSVGLTSLSSHYSLLRLSDSFIPTRWSGTPTTGVTLGLEFESDRRNNCVILYLESISFLADKKHSSQNRNQ